MVKRRMIKFGKDARVTPYSFLMTTEIQDIGLTSHPKDGALSQYSVPVTTLGH